MKEAKHGDSVCLLQLSTAVSAVLPALLVFVFHFYLKWPFKGLFKEGEMTYIFNPSTLETSTGGRRIMSFGA